GIAQVTSDEAAEELYVLNGDRLVQSQLTTDTLDVLASRLLRQDAGYRIARDPQHQEHDCGHKPHHQQRAEQPAGEVTQEAIQVADPRSGWRRGLTHGARASARTMSD